MLFTKCVFDKHVLNCECVNWYKLQNFPCKSATSNNVVVHLSQCRLLFSSRVDFCDNPLIVLVFASKFRIFSPNDTLVGWVHGRAEWTAPVLSELSHVGQGAVYSESNKYLLGKKEIINQVFFNYMKYICQNDTINKIEGELRDTSVQLLNCVGYAD
jgi:hypothetical protein